MANDPLWIEHANLDRGALSRKANAAGKSTASFAKENSSAPGKLGKQARAAQTLSKLRTRGVTKPKRGLAKESRA